MLRTGTHVKFVARLQDRKMCDREGCQLALDLMYTIAKSHRTIIPVFAAVFKHHNKVKSLSMGSLGCMFFSRFSIGSRKGSFTFCLWAPRDSTLVFRLGKYYWTGPDNLRVVFFLL